MSPEREALKLQLMEFVKRVSGVNPGLKSPEEVQILPEIVRLLTEVFRSPAVTARGRRRGREDAGVAGRPGHEGTPRTDRRFGHPRPRPLGSCHDSVPHPPVVVAPRWASHSCRISRHRNHELATRRALAVDRKSVV